MHTTQKPIGFWSAVSMGVGAMVGAGIFALLGEASSIASSAVYVSFIIGGVIALSSAYSLGFVIIVIAAEYLLQKVHKRQVMPRTP